MDGILRRAVVVREFLEKVPRDVKRVAIVALALIMVGVIWHRAASWRCSIESQAR